MDTEGELVLYDGMRRAIRAAFKVHEVAEIRNKALAIEMYMRQQRNFEAEKRAIEIRLRAERKLGALLKETNRAQGRRSDIETSVQPEQKSFREQLDEHGISPTQATRWQKLAAVPAAEFEATFAGQGKPSTTGIINGSSTKQ